MTETALFVIDIQNDLAGCADTEIPDAQRIRDAAATLLKNSRSVIRDAVEKDKIPSITLAFVQHEESPDKGLLNKGTKPWELVFPPSATNACEQLVSKTTS